MCYISKYLWKDWLKCSNDISIISMVVFLEYYCNFIHNFMRFKKKDTQNLKQRNLNENKRNLKRTKETFLIDKNTVDVLTLRHYSHVNHHVSKREHDFVINTLCLFKNNFIFEMIRNKKNITCGDIIAVLYIHIYFCGLRYKLWLKI